MARGQYQQPYNGGRARRGRWTPQGGYRGGRSNQSGWKPRYSSRGGGSNSSGGYSKKRKSATAPRASSTALNQVQQALGQLQAATAYGIKDSVSVMYGGDHFVRRGEGDNGKFYFEFDPFRVLGTHLESLMKTDAFVTGWSIEGDVYYAEPAEFFIVGAIGPVGPFWNVPVDGVTAAPGTQEGGTTVLYHRTSDRVEQFRQALYKSESRDGSLFDAPLQIPPGYSFPGELKMESKPIKSPFGRMKATLRPASGTVARKAFRAYWSVGKMFSDTRQGTPETGFKAPVVFGGIRGISGESRMHIVGADDQEESQTVVSMEAIKLTVFYRVK